MAQNEVSDNKGSKNKSFEEDLTRLEEIVSILESGEKTLAENLKLYEEGIRLSRSCHKKLDEVEGRLQILNMEYAENGDIQTSDFDPEERG
ncbi:MAG TPA: exodeoxyribonuclease VII small subunit [Firmicutes bacterium]|nr:exodeoxyribonuclease VII small subunit [Bacillota bacterium]HBG44588.1 exodeoxyribonuclease VII small subunit [Bacillota bacterium]HBL49037.1 exodeoxyribonuclease VII small subunit [Bacillota bacterium]HBL69145.1 exodeoxyribonuclease VII small subunit [Bacillota bacterium]HCF92379.1 exodeoxyribonuclease VII small subunit [Bacillota bacterium]